MSKILLIAAAGAGYVLGSKAGRERYEQIRSIAGKTTSNPAVSRVTSQVGSKVRDKVPFGSSSDARVPAYSADAAHDAEIRPQHV